MADNVKQEDENIQPREEGGDDEVRAWSFCDSLRLRPDAQHLYGTSQLYWL